MNEGYSSARTCRQTLYCMVTIFLISACSETKDVRPRSPFPYTVVGVEGGKNYVVILKDEDGDSTPVTLFGLQYVGLRKGYGDFRDENHFITHYMDSLLIGKRVRLEDTAGNEVDAYSGPSNAALVRTQDSILVNERLVEQGYASPSISTNFDSTRKRVFKEMDDRAAIEYRGVWGYRRH